MDVDDLIDFLLQDSDISLSKTYEKSEERWLLPDAQITFARSSLKSTCRKSKTYSSLQSESWDDIIEDLDNLILTPFRLDNMEENDGNNNLMKTKCSGRKNKEVKDGRSKNQKTRLLEEKTSHNKLRRPKKLGKLGVADMETERKGSTAEYHTKDGQYKHQFRQKNDQNKILNNHEADKGPPSKSNEKLRKTERKERRSRAEYIDPDICTDELTPINSIQTITKYKIHNKKVPSNEISSDCNDKLDGKLISKKKAKKKRHPGKSTVNNTKCVVKTKTKTEHHKDNIQ